MTVLDELARFARDFEPETLTEADRDHLKLHVLDTLGAMLAGARTKDGEALTRLAAGDASGVDGAILTKVATARATEMDDIHLASCTTPGAIVVPTALLLSSASELASPDSFLASVAAGYEVVVRVGLAIDGPAALLRGIWPTLFAAPLGAAAVAARAFELSSTATAGAFATALALSKGTSLRPRGEPTARWLTLGAACRDGVLAARAAREGIEGSPDLLETRDPQVAGVTVSGERLVEELGGRSRFREVGLKPYPIARQALAAVEACRLFAEESSPETSDIEEIELAVPAAQKAILDRAERRGAPVTRMESIVDARYLTALAILAPERLRDVERSPPFTSPAIRDLASRVLLVAASDLESHYPERWPARVTIRRKGVRSGPLVREVLSPRGDRESGYSWDDVLEKLRRALASSTSEGRIETLASRLRAIEQSEWPCPELEASLGSAG